MARKRVVEAPSLHSWEDVNDALRQIAEAQIALGEIQSDMQKQILGAQKVAEEQSKPLNDNVAKLEREIKSFVTDHRDEMGKTKSMVLTFGEVGFRLSTSVSLPRAKEKLEEIIRRLKSRQMTDCIVVEEKVSKEALKKYGEDTVNAVGATWKQSDVFGYRGDQQHAEQGCTHPVPAAVREEWLHQIQQETQDTAKADDRVPDGQERRCAGRPPDGGQAGA